MSTTITIGNNTKDRLADYKFGNLTFDDVLNMRACPQFTEQAL